MISEAIGKIVGMAMAYVASVLGLFLAYVNYRKRILKAEKVMTPVAWAVVVATVLVATGGVVVVVLLAAAPPAATAEAPALAAAETPDKAAAPAAAAVERHPPAGEGEGSGWPLLGLLLPAAIFLFATWITVALYRHFSRNHR